jgi:long-subunit acyl-CoA synthetase (AMP-forming)
MSGKITLITPPDIFENFNESVMFMHIDNDEQDIISKFLGDHGLENDLNFYVYSGENNLDWIFYALNLCEHKYINLDYYNNITQALSGYILAHSNVYYKVTDKNLAAIYNHINHNRVDNVNHFLERTFSVKNPNKS